MAKLTISLPYTIRAKGMTVLQLCISCSLTFVSTQEGFVL